MFDVELPGSLGRVWPFGVLEPCDGKLSRTVLRGEGSRKAPDLPGASGRIKENNDFKSIHAIWNCF